MAQKTTLTYNVVAYIEQKTVDYYGGQQAIQDSINKQLTAVNTLYNSQAGLNNYYNFTAVSFVYFTDNTADDNITLSKWTQPAESENKYRIVYNSFPNSSSNTYRIAFEIAYQAVIFSYRESASGNGNLFERVMTNTLAHELGHSRGAWDIYAGNINANQNGVNPNLGWRDSLPSLMNSLFSYNTFDKYSLYMINRTATLYGASTFTDAQRAAITGAAFPTTISVKVLNSTGGAAVGATVKFYAIPWFPADNFSIAAASPTITQTTNSSGNVDFMGSAQNPFDMTWGSPARFNLFVAATYNGQTKYTWMPFYEASNAFIDGVNYVKTISFSSTNISPQVSIGPSGPLIGYNPLSTVFPIWAYDLDGTISSVKIYDNGVFVENVTNMDATTKIYWYYTQPLALGKHTFTVVVADNSGATQTSAPMIVDVKAAHVVKAAITSPANNTNYAAPGNILITAQAYEGDGSISKVEFYKGSTLLGTDTSVPYSFNWTGVAAGTYSLTVKAYDSQTTPATATSTAVTVIVKTAPVVSITSPVTNAVYNTIPASITINATASVTGGSISKVEFYNGATLLNADNTSPYSYTWTGVTAGTYSITAKAYDSQATPVTTTSAAVSVYVNTPPAVSITSPASNATFTAPATINITSTATDADGIQKVEFYNGASLLGTVTVSPYNYSWTNVVAGTYSITAKAYDNKGGTKTSTAVTNLLVNPGSGCTAPQYVAGAAYTDGSLVKNVGNKYQCKPWPYSGWCSGAAAAYAPGTGTNWSDAWTLIGSCTRIGKDDAANSTVSIFPNPAQDIISIQLKETEGEVVVTVKNLSAETLMTQHFTTEKGSTTITLNTEQLRNGIYLLQTSHNGEILTTSRISILK
ncbi:MAG: T9SS type A sorting domain-containing protein [Cytophagaceae bacterium]|nr:T9SS type A sorting domain-containing protein [Cytophagaceae bacterium]